MHDTARLFCARCGSKDVRRLAVTVRKNGKMFYHHHAARELSSRGERVRARAGGGGACAGSFDLDLTSLVATLASSPPSSQFSLPKPVAGREAGLLLREDQLLQGAWKQRVHNRSGAASSAFDSDIMHSLGMRVAAGSSVQVGVGKKNPNALKGRERRGKKDKDQFQRKLRS